MATFMARKHRPGYLRRWVVVDTVAGGVWVHKFEGPDPRSAIHNHPRSFVSFVVRGGGYVEVRRCGGSHRVRRCTVKRAGKDWHRVAWVEGGPTWTVVLLGPKRGRSWTSADLGR